MIRGLLEGKKLNDILREGLKPVDKKVVDAFYNKESAKGKLLITDGKTLDKVGLGGQEVAKWESNKIKITIISSVRSDDEILRYLKKSAPKNTFHKHTPIEEFI